METQRQIFTPCAFTWNKPWAGPGFCGVRDPPADWGAEDEDEDIELCLTCALWIFQCLTSFVHCCRKDPWSSQKYFDENQSKLFQIEPLVKPHLTLLTHYQISFDVLSFLLRCICFCASLTFGTRQIGTTGSGLLLSARERSRRSAAAVSHQWGEPKQHLPPTTEVTFWSFMLVLLCYRNHQ